MDLAGASIYTNMDGLMALKVKASEDSKGALDEVARQFESMFVQQMLKTMRQASLGEGLMDSEQSLFYRDMYDKQLSIQLSESGGIGLADVIKRQLGGAEPDAEGGATLPVKTIEEYRRLAMAVKMYRTSPAANTSVNRGDSVAAADGVSKTGRTENEKNNPLAAVTTLQGQTDPRQWSPQEFIEQLWPLATEAAGLIGIKPQALLAQAALETGWGKQLMGTAEGAPANNLFGIKADRRWGGDRVSVNTLEYEAGTAVKKRDVFRSYESLRDSFHDYVDFLQSNPRYSEALEVTDDSAAFFNELQRAGYATDPDYANKINAVLNGSEMTKALDKLKAGEIESL
ncbi:flagellar assembly peptidoglycan hydrolase FlgJ [Sedimenticola sp.]|uniref:flagellar assembly peptidoglycan hydrolase FlgJ n=1 Tax=Sedimenticola sp. TaxID=1940285 RepID=UPI003D0FBB1B